MPIICTSKGLESCHGEERQLPDGPNAQRRSYLIGRLWKKSFAIDDPTVNGGAKIGSDDDERI
ncbi:hypothetical protein RJ641_009800 [Dillenia turbinata]|uniref:Uncharacterized protein n=1 Tax=Dillenia turbinata TaxID=194707 RepID=A0AAN8V5Y3_9MAGN